ncbi:DUF488 domain-containing protein [Methyloradius palustris]|uniref:DUF488 domain-containing protein n=1 Tax=Methyloradius palustris TaxID=2778876 RepID=A0A8D5G9Y3_9PROT|nr:DUF488 domain-containing protein [Methyloradius palustris]BCM24346.1 hypothetical protein ZMTM_06050 [Methyloradius palustris]
MTSKVFTIGFTQTTAQQFFGNISKNHVSKIIDVRLNNISQLAGFAKRDDLKYFLKEICNAEYLHLPELAPTKDILDAYKKSKGSWEIYEDKFMNLMERRNIENNLSPTVFNNACLLCSEKTAHYCHRRLVVEYLNSKWGNKLEVKHIG